MRLTATKEFSFDCAHMLSNHEGLCANLHGHTYKMQVTLQSLHARGLNLSGPAEGMVVDFKDIKEIVDKRIVKKFDHAFIYWQNGDGENECEKEIMETLQRYGKKIYFMEDRPTAENMARHFFAAIAYCLKATEYSVAVTSVKVWETPTSYAEFRL